MSFRIEDKLYINRSQIIDFKEFLSKNSAQPIYKSRTIKSLYFDNKNLDMYNDSIEGLTPRKKIRIRKYPNGEDKALYFEVKNSSVEGRFKTRKKINEDKFNSLTKRGYLDEQYGVCFPKLYVIYQREYFKLDDTRISIDKDLQYYNFHTEKFFNDMSTIVEVKTSINKDQDDLIKMFPFQKIRFSKYCLAVDKVLI